MLEYSNMQLLDRCDRERSGPRYGPGAAECAAAAVPVTLTAGSAACGPDGLARPDLGIGCGATVRPRQSLI